MKSNEIGEQEVSPLNIRKAGRLVFGGKNYLKYPTLYGLRSVEKVTRFVPRPMSLSKKTASRTFRISYHENNLMTPPPSTGIVTLLNSKDCVNSEFLGD